MYIYSQLPISRIGKGPRKVSDLARCPTYPRFRISCKEIAYLTYLIAKVRDLKTANYKTINVWTR